MIEATATELPRLMACIGSRLMQGAKVPSVERDETTRDEGNAVHYMSQTAATGKMTVEEMIDRKAPNGVYMTPEMAEHVAEYHAHFSRIGDRYNEIDLHHSNDGYQINGRADDVIWIESDRELHVNDLKYGHSLVEVFENWTLLSHVFGWCVANPTKIPDTIVMSVFQPRGYHRDGTWRSWTINGETMFDYWRQMTAHLQKAGDELRTSDLCKGCVGAHSCLANHRAGGNAIDVIDKAFVDTLSGDDLSYAIHSLEVALKRGKARIDSLHELATHQLSTGKLVPDYALTRSEGRERWRDGTTADALAVITGEKVTKDVLLTPNQLRDKGVDPKVVAAFSHRPDTGLKLVRASADKIAKQLFKGKR